jgi:hypothetical protein
VTILMSRSEEELKESHRIVVNNDQRKQIETVDIDKLPIFSLAIECTVSHPSQPWK